MTKLALAFSSLLVACTVGTPLPSQDQVDAPVGIDAPGQDAVASACIDRSPTPGVAHIHTAGQTDNGGQGCVAGLCHLATNLGPQAPAWQFAGTLYKPDGVTPNAGAIVKVTAAGGVNSKTAVTDLGGNFYIPAGQLPNAFPATVLVTACPTLTNMTDTLTNVSTPAIGGDCNGCHNNQALPGGYTPITLAP